MAQPASTHISSLSLFPSFSGEALFLGFLKMFGYIKGVAKHD
jgi:hypothetical protein